MREPPAADDQRRLGTLVWENSGGNKFEEEWIEKLRAASAQREKPRRWRLKLVAASLLTIGMASAGCILRFGLHFGSTCFPNIEFFVPH